MSNPIEVKYEGITITYRESDNRWAFELRGRQRSSESLEKAKEAIDKPVNDKEEKPFQRIPIYIKGKRYGNASYEQAEITSVAEGRSGATPYVWVSRGKERSKESSYFCFKVNDANTQLVTDIAAIQKQIDELKTQLSDKEQKLQRIEV